MEKKDERRPMTKEEAFGVFTSWWSLTLIVGTISGLLWVHHWSLAARVTFMAFTVATLWPTVTSFRHFLALRRSK